MFEAGRLRPVVGETHPFEDFAAAFESYARQGLAAARELDRLPPCPADAKRGEEDEWPIARPFPSIVSSSTMSWA